MADETYPKGIWECRIGVTGRVPDGSDLPMRDAVRLAYIRITGQEPDFIFSGWSAELTPIEQEVVDG